jgi:glyoxylase-like metal-dependent hydrolase (beta-lactamase superfamily II)
LTRADCEALEKAGLKPELADITMKPSAETVLAGDCCYFHKTLTDLKLPGFGHDPDEPRRSIQRLTAMDDRGARIIAGHDPEQWAGLPHAPHPMIG